MASPCKVASFAPVRPRHRTATATASVALALSSLAVAACDRPPSDDGIREWTAADHDRAEEKARINSGAQASPQAKGSGGKDDLAAVVELTWRQQCATCHGMVGRGDGPNGPMVKAPDLTREDWQAKVTDDDIAAIIRSGKGQMPKFDLSDPVVAGLVVRVRAVRGKSP